MSKSMKDLVSEARANVVGISPTEAQTAARKGDLIVDVREKAELESDGTVKGAVHIPRGLLEAQADPDTGKSNADLVSKRDGGGRVHVLCASGARAALAADTLRRMGYEATVIDGGLGGWKNAKLPVQS